MTPEEFARAKTRIMRTYILATSRARSMTVYEIGSLMGDDDVLTVGVAPKTRTPHPHYMVQAHFRPATKEVTADQVAEELERVWTEQLAIGKELHLITQSEGEVVLEFVMVDDGMYQSGQIVVDMTKPGPIVRRTKAGKHRARDRG